MILPSKEFLDIFKSTPGALSVTESIAIINLAAEAPSGNYLELGTYKGKSAFSAATTLKKGEFVLLEPDFDLSDFDIDLSIFTKIVRAEILLVKPLSYYSCDYLKKYWSYLYSYVFVDSGSHQDGLPMQEAKLLEDMVIPGGLIVWHDFRNQFREPAEAAEYLVSTGKYEWINIDWKPIVDYVKENNLEEGNNSWHIYEDVPFPNFVGAIKRK